MTLPNLAGVATADLVEKIGASNFSASYINWSRTLHLLRTHAPGWLPEVVPNNDGGLLHAAPVGCYLLIRFRNGADTTPPVPQAVMDQRNNAIPHDRITARDVTDTHRRGICMAAAMTFGLAYELWAKLPLESGYVEPAAPEPEPVDPKIEARKAELTELALHMIECEKAGKQLDAIRLWYSADTFNADVNEANEERIFVWGLLKHESKLRSAIKANKPIDKAEAWKAGMQEAAT